jgi:hypothetical protein
LTVPEGMYFLHLMCCERGGFGKATTRALDTTLSDESPT